MGAPRLLPFVERGEIDPVAFLEERSRRLANIVEATSRRKDVREFRARLLILLLEMRCPLNLPPNRRWYVPGAVARVGPEGLRRAWHTYFGEEPKSIRTFRAHLSALEQSLAIMRSPGDWIPIYTTSPEKRPRHADTIHILESDRSAIWWEEVGRDRMAKKPKTRHNPDKWALAFETWRTDAATERRDLFSILRAAESTTEPVPLEAYEEPEKVSAKIAARGLATLLRDKAEPLDLMIGLRKAGCPLRGRNTWTIASDRKRFEGSVALLACALARGDRIRSRAGWLVRAWRTAGLAELVQAVGIIRGRGLGPTLA